MTRRASLGFALTGLVLSSGCSSEPVVATLSIDARVPLCTPEKCMSLPAAGADVEVRTPSGRLVSRSVLDEQGRFSLSIRPGATYEVHGPGSCGREEHLPHLTRQTSPVTATVTPRA